MNFKAWLHSIIAAAIGGAASSLGAVWVDPAAFNFTPAGWMNIGKVALAGAVIPVLAILKQSPLPPDPPPAPTLLKCLIPFLAVLSFLARYQRLLVLIGIASGSLAFCLLATGCVAPIWLVDAEGVAAVLVASATSIGSFVAGLTGNTIAADVLAAISTWASKVEAGLKNVQSLIQNYKVSPNESLLQEIDQATQTIVADIPALASIGNVPAAVSAKLEAWGQLVLSQLQSITSVLPLAAARPAPGSVVAVTIPLPTASIKAAHNSLLTAATGDADVDTAAAAATTI